MRARMQSPTPLPAPRSWLPIGPGALRGNPAHEWPNAGSRFYSQHLWMPLTIFAGLSWVLMGLHGDLWLADRLYAMEGHAWNLQTGYITQDLLHATGRQISKDLWFTLALMVGISLLVRQAKQWRRPLLYLLLATALSTAAVGLLKRWTNMDCPWDLLRYGGDKLYYGLFMHRPSILGHAKCFPAGHASAGYAWIALYFFFLSTRPRWRWWGLGFALGLGALFGVAQQLRGAHFLSHDLWTLMICWLIALTLYLLMLGHNRNGQSVEARP
jgi:membrane-associated PAP2 superfamily phosphatase